MNKTTLLLAAAAAALAVGCSDKTVNRITKTAEAQCILMDSQLADGETPRCTDADGNLWKTNQKWWCSGFFPGTCWLTYELGGNEEVKAIAEKQTLRLADPDKVFSAHDVGFQILCSYGQAYRLTGDEKYLPMIQTAAEFLANRFSPIAGTIMSWDSNEGEQRVIIDNMMNLEILTFAAEKFNRPEWKEIAIKHAETTIRNHFRDDFSTYHVVVYSTVTGEVLRKHTAQGYADWSSWARGQAWGLYGYTMMYRETGRKEFLDQAENIASMLKDKLSPDPVPAWDFDAPADSAWAKDASAAAIMASAHVELGKLTGKEEYIAQARKIVDALSTPEYLAEPGTNAGFLLKHSTGNFMKNSEVDVPLTYADYYYLEALLRLRALDSSR